MNARQRRKAEPQKTCTSPLGRVTVTDTITLLCTPTGRWVYGDRGYVWRKGCMVFVERPVGDAWYETGKVTARIRQPPRAILPDMSAEDRRAWAAFVLRYEHLPDRDLAGVLPGWDDVATFDPPRVPGGNYYDDPLWPDDHPRRWERPMTRALALAKMARRLSRDLDCPTSATPPPGSPHA